MRRRMIDPGFWSDSKIISLSIPARLFYIGLWNYADDEGFFLEDPPAIKRTIFPDQKFDVPRALNECSCFLKRYEYKDSGQVACEIAQFLDWQTINRPTKSKIKPFCTLTEDSLSTHGVLTPKLKEVKLREVNIKDGQVVDLPFDVFWKLYPVKNAKNKTHQQWQKECAAVEGLPDVILAALQRQIGWRAALPDGAFIPRWKDPERWLRDHRWEDEIQADDDFWNKEGPTAEELLENIRARKRQEARAANGSK